MILVPGTIKKLSVLFALGLLLFLPQPLIFGQNNAVNSTGSLAGSRRGDNLTIKLALRGPGDEVYFWWGHVGLVIEDKSTGQARFYDWGVFSFENDNFFYNFAFGRLLYSCAVSRAERNYDEYIKTNRDITLYTLDLPAFKKVEVQRFVEKNVLPENRDYYYHQFKDNCATRIRDIIDMALDGRFKAQYSAMPGRFTFRQHVMRHTWFSPFFDWILNFWMGQGIDRPITVWEEMFLPSEIPMRAMEFSYTGPDGMQRPLVSSVEILNRSRGRPAVLDAPRLQWPRELGASLLFCAILLLLYKFFGGKRVFRTSFGILNGLLGLFFGIAGSLLVFMSFFTNHDYTFHNSNVVFVNPLFFAAIPLGLIFAFTGNEKKRFFAASLLRAFWTYVLLGGILTMVIKLNPAFYQYNQVTQALVLPLAPVMVFILVLLGRVKKT